MTAIKILKNGLLESYGEDDFELSINAIKYFCKNPEIYDYIL